MDARENSWIGFVAVLLAVTASEYTVLVDSSHIGYKT